MTARKVMSRQDVFRLIEVIGFLTLAGKEVPRVKVDGDHAEPGDVAEALAAFGRKIASHLEALPERASDDMRAQEAVRVKLDRILTGCALVIERTIQEIGAAD